LPLVSFTPGANLPPVSFNITSEIGGKIWRLCCWYQWCTLTCKYLHEFRKKFKPVLFEYSGAKGKLIHEKNQKQKISWHCPFKLHRQERQMHIASSILWKPVRRMQMK
jgi:hypothetical protein